MHGSAMYFEQMRNFGYPMLLDAEQYPLNTQRHPGRFVRHRFFAQFNKIHLGFLIPLSEYIG
jgi:hypothetical protein